MRKEVEVKLELVKQCLIHFGKIAPKPEKIQYNSREEAEKKGFFVRDFGMEQWDWPQGIGIYGLHNGKNDEFIKGWAWKEISKGLPTKNVNTVCPMLTLIDFPEFDELTEEWMKWVENEFPRTEEKGLQHLTSGIDKYTVKENKEQIWADTLFMTILFMAKMGVKYNNKKWIDDASYQVLVHTKYLLDRESNLFYHGWNFDTKSNYGSNFWCRGNSWLTMGIPLFLEITKKHLSNYMIDYLTNMYEKQINTLIHLRSENGLWHTILNNPTSYTETSGSAGIIAGILIGLNHQLIDNTNISKDFINQSVKGLLNQIDEKGVVHGVSAGTAISENEEDYHRIIRTPMVYGQAMVLIALEEYLQWTVTGG